jgi:hypothetical protein
VRTAADLFNVYPDLEAELRAMDAGLDKLLVACRQQLLKAYLRSRDAEEVKEIAETLGAIIAAGKWPDWQLDFDMAIEERCRSPSIQPKLKLVSDAAGRA